MWWRALRSDGFGSAGSGFEELVVTGLNRSAGGNPAASTAAPTSTRTASPQLQHLFGLFPREQVLVFRYRALIDDPARALDRVCAFLGVPLECSAGCRART